MTLFYVPLEPYQERYTMQLSAPVTGWMESNFIKAGVDYDRVAPPAVLWNPGTIKTGQVIDAETRARWAFSQVEDLIGMASRGKITDEDVIYFEDFWHPGIQQVKYAFDLLKVRPLMYAYCWAQSYDIFDFTFKMLSWIRHFENGTMAILDGVFVANTLLKTKMVNAGVDHSKVHVVGLPFCSEEVLGRCPASYANQVYGDPYPGLAAPPPRTNTVVYSSRWDSEKNPDFFLLLVDRIMQKRKDVQFEVCTSAENVRSNDPKLLTMLASYLAKYPDNLKVYKNLSKEQYYARLCNAKVQFNCASQDWVSFTLLEATVCGCYPVYPNYRSFPETFCHDFKYLYQELNLTSAVARVQEVLSDDTLWTAQEIKFRKWIYSRFDGTWFRILQRMQIGMPGITDAQAAILGRFPYLQ